MTIVRKQHFVCTDLDRNSNKFWTIELRVDNSVRTVYGRVGVSGEETIKNFPTTQKAESFYNSKVRDKQKVKDGRRDAYTEITLVDSQTTTNSPGRHISDIAVSQIQTKSDDVRLLIKYLSDVNIHNITSNTSVKYDLAVGTFTTPLGIVDQTCLDKAKDLLANIAAYVNNGQVESKDCLILVNKYLRQIPQDLGGSHVKIHVKDVFGAASLLQAQQDIIDGLEAALATAKPVQTEESVFNARLEPAENSDEIVDLLKGRSYSSIYKVEIKPVIDRWEQYGSKLENKRKTAHGTNPANILSIFKGGLIIPPNYSNGRRFGNGVYTSDRLDMALSYANTNRRNSKDVRFVFVCEVALGKVYYGSGNSLSSEYHSRWAEKDSGTSQIIVYRTDQINLLNLIEF